MFSQGPFNYNRFDLFEKKSKPDFLDMDKDGDKKESMKKAIKEKGGCSKCEGECKCDDKKDVKENREMAYGGGKPGKGSGDGSKPKGITNGKTYTMKGKDGKPLFDEEVATITKDDVINHLIENNYVNNEVSAEAMFNHITDEFLENIEEEIMEGYKDPTQASRLGGVSPNMKMNQKSHQLQKTEPGSARQKRQTKATTQMNNTLHSGANMARRS